MRREKIHEQCETGPHRATALLPEFADVLRSLVLDSDVLDCGSFEEWAENLGYSRAVEAVAAYDAGCDTYDARICGADGVPRRGEQRVAINRQAQQLSPRGDNCEGHRGGNNWHAAGKHPDLLVRRVIDGVWARTPSSIMVSSAGPKVVAAS
jgi:hypothetical protein